MVKKGKKGGKKKKAKDVVTETERELYNLKLLDYGKKIERLDTRNEDLNLRIDELKEMGIQVDQEKAEIIAALKKELLRKKAECEEIQERIQGLLDAKVNDEDSFKNKVHTLELRFQVTQERIVGEIKILGGELYTLEEFKTNREALNRKYKRIQQHMADKEIEHQKALKDVESKFIKARNRLRKTFEEQIMKLSDEFHDITEKRITPTTHRTIRENIAIKTEMDSLDVSCETMVREISEIKENSKIAREKIALYETNIDTIIAKMAIQNRLLEIAVDEHAKVKNELDSENARAIQFQGLQNNFDKTLIQSAKLRHMLGLLRQHSESLIIEQNELKQKLNKINESWNFLMKIIMKAMAYLKHMIHIDDDPKFYRDFWLFKYDDQNYLENILDILYQAKIDEEESEICDYWDPPVDIRSYAGKDIPSEDFMSHLSSIQELEFLEEEEEVESEIKEKYESEIEELSATKITFSEMEGEEEGRRPSVDSSIYFFDEDDEIDPTKEDDGNHDKENH